MQRAWWLKTDSALITTAIWAPSSLLNSFHLLLFPLHKHLKMQAHSHTCKHEASAMIKSFPCFLFYCGVCPCACNLYHFIFFVLHLGGEEKNVKHLFLLTEWKFWLRKKRKIERAKHILEKVWVSEAKLNRAWNLMPSLFTGVLCKSIYTILDKTNVVGKRGLQKLSLPEWHIDEASFKYLSPDLIRALRVATSNCNYFTPSRCIAGDRQCQVTIYLY